MPRPPARNSDGEGSALRGVDLGLSLVVSVLLVGGAGYALDRWQDWTPWGMLAGGALGFAAWLRMVWVAMRKM